LPPIHPCFDETSSKCVGRDHDTHSNPKRRDIPRGPCPLPNCRRREIAVPQRAGRNVFGKLDEILFHAKALRLRNLPSPAFPLNAPSSTTTLPRDKTISDTPRTFRPSYAL